MITATSFFRFLVAMNTEKSQQGFGPIVHVFGSGSDGSRQYFVVEGTSGMGRIEGCTVTKPYFRIYDVAGCLKNWTYRWYFLDTRGIRGVDIENLTEMLKLARATLGVK